MSLLLHHGADANARDNWNYTPLHEAAIKGKIDVCIGTKAPRCSNTCRSYCTHTHTDTQKVSFEFKPNLTSGKQNVAEMMFCVRDNSGNML